MSEAPERIWAAPDELDQWRWPVASKLPFLDRRAHIEVGYVRADIHAARIEELERERDKLQAELREAREVLTRLLRTIDGPDYLIREALVMEQFGTGEVATARAFLARSQE